jgi:hypothetical protein
MTYDFFFVVKRNNQYMDGDGTFIRDREKAFKYTTHLVFNEADFYDAEVYMVTASREIKMEKSDFGI